MDSEVAQLPLAERAWLWFDTYKRQVALVAVILVVAGLVTWFILWQHEQKQVEAGIALTQVATGQLEGSSAQVADAYLKVAKNYPNSMSGARALLLAAGALFAENKFPEAQSQFERFIREYQGSPFMGEALLGVAACLDAEGKTDQAAAAYQDLVTHHSTESFIPQVKFSLARLYEAQHKPELARDYYQDVERASPFTALGNEAGVRLEELIQKNPKLAPAPPAPSPATVTNLAPLLQKK
ncbi:MAG TPA: tetratricopeptide repeat protein [Verrucomicrobiae bacterium]|nr:tetratricopeptide repeat protein [Verrucomicrobiae bacterium]